jgi:hypothetical protein
MVWLTTLLAAVAAAVPGPREVSPMSEEAVVAAKPADASAVSGIRQELTHSSARIEQDSGTLLFAETGSPVDSMPGAIVRVPGPSAWPPEVRTAFNVVLDERGRIRLLLESPVSESGDWVLQFTYLFDEAGRTIAFQRSFGAFGAECADIARQVSTAYFSGDGRLLARDYRLEDGQGKPLSPKGCELRTTWGYRIQLDVASALATRRLGAAVKRAGAKKAR